MSVIGAVSVVAQGTLAVLGILFVILRLPLISAAVLGAVLAVQLAAFWWRQGSGRIRLDLDPCAALVGALIVLVPAMHPEALLAPILWYLVLDAAFRRSSAIISVLPLFLILGAWLSAELFATRDPLFAMRLLGGDLGPANSGFLAFAAWVRTGMPAWVRQWEWLLRLFACAALFSHLSAHSEKLRAVVRGIGAGLFITLPIAAAEVWLQASGRQLRAFVPNQNEYWDSIGRISGTFSDPNAFGVAILLCIPILVPRCSDGVRARLDPFLPWIAAAAAITALFSGSRTYILGLAALAFVVLVVCKPKVALGLTAAAVACLVVLNVSPTLQAALTSPPTPESLRRAANSFVLSNISETLFSRALFWKIGAEVFSSSPWLGVGPGKFREFVTPLTFGTPGVPGLWTDNANNMYLEIAVELGLLGAGFVVLCLSALKFRSGTPPVVKAGCAAFLAMLLFGPHLEFNEIAALAAVLLASAAELRVGLRHHIAVIGAVILVPFIFLRAAAGQFGFSGWERDAARYFRWTGPRAQGWVECEAGAESTLLYLRASRPRNQEPVAVEVEPIGSAAKQITLHSDEISAVQLPCAAAPEKLPVGYRVITARPWSPRSLMASSDGRLLGVQVVTKDPRSTLPF